MQTNEWGKAAWTFLGAIAYDYPEGDVDRERAKRTGEAIYALQFITPCPHCRRSITTMLEELPYEHALQNRAALTHWLYALHNKVNDKLRNQYFAFYDAPLTAPCDVVGTCLNAPCSWNALQDDTPCSAAYPRVPWACTHMNPSKQEVDRRFEEMRAGCK